MIKKKTLLSLLTIGTFALTACDTVDDVVDMDLDPTTEQTDETTKETTADDYANVTVQPEEVFDIFLDNYPNTKITQIQLDKDMGSFVYKVEGFEGDTEYELEINPVDSTIVREDMDTEFDGIDDLEITREHAEKVMDLVDQALADAEADTTVKEWTLDMDDGIAKLEVELDQPGFDDIEYTFNVDTGEIIERDQ